MVGSLSYQHASGLEGGARLAWLDPSNLREADQLTEIAIMAAFKMPATPLRALLQYTLRGEEAAVAYGNNSLDAMVQVTF